MNTEDGSDILAELLPSWIREDESLQALLEDPRRPSEEPPAVPGRTGFTQKGYWLMAKIRWLAYQNLSASLKDQTIRPSRERFSGQYMAALLHRTLISLASADIVEEKKILGLWLAARLISRLGVTVSRMAS